MILGAHGQLGQCLQKEAASHTSNVSYIFFGRKDCDIQNEEQVYNVLSLHVPNIIINCTAYTAVDKAESEEHIAHALNASAVATLAKAAQSIDALLIHVSTDFVFNGLSNIPLLESDNCEPIGIYGSTKLEGEKMVQMHCTKYFIVRTSWLYSDLNANFFVNISKYAKERTELNVVYDQIGTPTLAYDLANVLLTIANSTSTAYGIYHYSHEGVCSWYDFATELVHLQHIKCHIKPIRSAQYPTPAKRPAYSVLDKQKIKDTFQIVIPHWRIRLEEFVKSISMN